MSTRKIKFTRKTIFVCVTGAHEGKIKDVRPETPPEDVARGFWLVDDAKANQCQVLAAVDKGIITGVWEIDQSAKWQNAKFGEIPTRSAIDIDARRKYCEVKRVLKDCPIYGAHVSSIVGVGRMYGPVRYNF